MLYKSHKYCLRITQHMKHFTQYLTKIYTTYKKILQNTREILEQHMTCFTQHIKIFTQHMTTIYTTYKRNYTTYKKFSNNIWHIVHNIWSQARQYIIKKLATYRLEYTPYRCWITRLMVLTYIGIGGLVGQMLANSTTFPYKKVFVL